MAAFAKGIHMRMFNKKEEIGRFILQILFTVFAFYL